MTCSSSEGRSRLRLQWGDRREATIRGYGAHHGGDDAQDEAVLPGPPADLDGQGEPAGVPATGGGGGRDAGEAEEALEVEGAWLGAPGEVSGDVGPGLQRWGG